jgi:hypothetical protein
MAQSKKRVQSGRLLKADGNIQVYNLRTSVLTFRSESLEQVTATFDPKLVAVRVSSGPDYAGDDLRVSQVVLTLEDLETLIASYRAYLRAMKKHFPAPAPDDYDPFLDPCLDGHTPVKKQSPDGQTEWLECVVCEKVVED